MIVWLKTGGRSFWRAVAAEAQQADRLAKSASQQLDKTSTSEKTVKAGSAVTLRGNADSFASTYAYINEALFGAYTVADGAKAAGADGSCGATVDSLRHVSTSCPPVGRRSAVPVSANGKSQPCTVGDAVTRISSPRTSTLAVGTTGVGGGGACVVAASSAAASIPRGTTLHQAGQSKAAEVVAAAGPAESAGHDADNGNAADHLAAHSGGGRGRAATGATASSAVPPLTERRAGIANPDRPVSQPLSSTLLSIDDRLSVLLNYPLAPAPTDRAHEQLMHSLRLLYDKVPSVTAVLEDTKSPEDKQKLENWKAEMVRKLGQAGFQKLQEETLRNGSSFHRYIENWLVGSDGSEVEIASAEVAGYWRSLESCGIMKQLSPVLATEHWMEHDQLRYKGAIDCVATYRDQPSIVEWKTSKKPKRSLSAAYDHPLQVAAYMGIWNRGYECHRHLQRAEPMTRVQQGVLVVAYDNGGPADVLVMPYNKCMYYWQEWLLRLRAFWMRKQQQLLTSADRGMATTSTSS